MPDTLLRSGARTRTRSSIEAQASRAAQGLRALSVGRGDAVALLLRNDFAFFEASRAAALAGASPVTLNWHLAPPEIAYVLQDSGAKAIIAHSDLLAAHSGIIPPGVTVLSVETPPEIASAYGHAPSCGAGGADLESWEAFAGRHAPLSDPCRDFTDTMTYTSGTTGKPKGVRKFSQDPSTAQRFLALRDRIYGIRAGIRALICGPLYHAAPNAFGMRAYAMADTVVMLPRFDPEAFLAEVERSRITTVFMVPTMFARLLKLPAETRRRYDVSSLDYVLCAAAHCPPQLKAAMQDWFGPVVHEFYGGTEQNYVSYCTPEDSRRKPGTVGRVMEGVSVRIVDGNFKDVAPGTAGEICSRLDIAPDFTYANLDHERAALDHGGLIATGDVGYLDKDGYLFLCDRRKDMVISGGVNIYPAEIEAALLNLPGVEDCAVFGIPDPDYGETLMAVVQPAAGVALSAGRLIADLKHQLAGYKVPRRIEFRTSLPRDDAGKIYKRQLRDPYWEACRHVPETAAT